MTSSKTTEVVPEPGRAATSPIEDPVPAQVRAVIELFTKQLANVAFPDIDASALRRQADELRTQATEVARAREMLDAALATFVTRLATLTETATRAVAYARIYSVAHPDQAGLATAIASLTEPAETMAASVTAGGKRKSRPPRRSADLFSASATSAPRDEPV